MTAHVGRQDLLAGLRRVGVEHGDVLFVHSSLSAFGYVEDGADAVLDALLEAVGSEGTLALPTFTWGEFHRAHGVVFDVARTPCETGRIPETFRQRPGVRRSVHICHSVAAFGPVADAILGDGVHSFWHGSPFDALYERNAWNLMLGVGFNSCTALHAAEEKSGVAYRAHRSFPDSRVRLLDGTEIPCPSLEFLRRDSSGNDFAKMEEVFRRRGLLRETGVGDGRLMNIRIRDAIDIGCEFLAADPDSLSVRR